jgi:hypothetical protein
VEAPHFASIVGIVETGFVFEEVDDQAHAAVGHEAFSGVRLGIVAVIPEKLNEARKWRAGSEKKAVHGLMVRACNGDWEEELEQFLKF